MDFPDAQDWLKLTALLDRACSSLRELFIKAFRDTFGCEWSQSVSHLIINHKDVQKLSLWHHQKIQEGNCNEWDITFLREIMTKKDLLNLTSKQLAGITQIVDIRNKMIHLPSSSVTQQQFSVWWAMLGQILVDFGTMSETSLEQLIQERRISNVEFVDPVANVDEVHVKRAGQLREKGNFAFKNGNYFKAIELFTDAIKLTSVSAADRALLCSNRCSAYIRQFQVDHHKEHLTKARLDAQKAVELASDWWMGYLCLGQVYTALGKFKKAEQCFDEAISKEPQNQTIKDAISSLRNKQGQYSRMDFLDPGQIPKSTTEHVDDFNKKTGSKFDAGLVNIMENMALTSGDAEFFSHEICRLGHRCRVGLDGLPLDNQLASDFYRCAAEYGSAEGMYSLGQMVVDGEGMQQDFKLGIKLLLEAAAQSPIDDCGLPRLGVAEAEQKLGLCYERGIGVPKDLIQAIFWYERSTYNGCPGAANNLGLIHESGVIGGKPNFKRAEQFYQLAARSGRKPDTNAMLNLAGLYEQRGDLDRASEYCRRAKTNGNTLPILDKLRDKLKVKMDVFVDSGIPAWEIENCIDISDLTVKERIERYCCEHIPHFDKLVKHFEAFETKLKVPLLTCIQTKDRFNPSSLKMWAKNSTYGKMLWTAKQHFLTAMHILRDAESDCPPLDICEQFIKNFAAGARIELMVSELSSAQHQQALAIVCHLLKQRTSFAEDVRVCYVALEGFASPEATINFLSQCIRDYPKNIYFLEWRAALFAFLGNYEDAICDANAAVQLDPSNVEILFDRAGMLRLATPNVNPQDAISNYKSFLELAPKDHRKYPEAFYAIATLSLPQVETYEKLICSNSNSDRKELQQYFIELKQWYDSGIAAETKQLQCFLPYESNHKAVVEAFLSMTAFSSTSSSLFKCVSFRADTPTKSTFDLCHVLADPNRILRLKQHREVIRRIRQIMSMGKATVTHATKTPVQQEMLLPLTEDGFKAITIRDMDPTRRFLYQGYELSATVIDEIYFTDLSLCMIVEDADGYVERCCIYNWPHVKDTAQVQKTFGPGTKIKIRNPHVGMAFDCNPVIRVDDPTNVTVQGSVCDMCRYCCKPNAHKVCPICKKNRYCNETCCTLDREKYSHDLICQWDAAWPSDRQAIITKHSTSNCEDGIFKFFVTKSLRLLHWLSFIWHGSIPSSFAIIRALYSYILLFRFLRNKGKKVENS